MSTTVASDPVADNQNTIIIGASIGSLLVLIIIAIIIWRLCCRHDEDDRSTKNTHDTIPTVTSMVEENPVDPDMPEDEVKSSPVVFANGKELPQIIEAKKDDVTPNADVLEVGDDLPEMRRTSVEKDSVFRSHSGPPANLSHYMSWTPNGNAFIPSEKDGSPTSQTSFKQEFSRQGLINTEMVNSGATIEADHKYITRVVHSYSGFKSTPISRASSVKRPLNTVESQNRPIDALKNTEKLNEGGVIAAEHKYVTHIGLPVSASYHTLPQTRGNSFKKPIQIIMSPDEALRRKESWYRNVHGRHKGPLAYSRSRTGSAYLGSL